MTDGQLQWVNTMKSMVRARGRGRGRARASCSGSTRWRAWSARRPNPDPDPNPHPNPSPHPYQVSQKADKSARRPTSAVRRACFALVTSRPALPTYLLTCLPTTCFALVTSRPAGFAIPLPLPLPLPLALPLLLPLTLPLTLTLPLPLPLTLTLTLILTLTLTLALTVSPWRAARRRGQGRRSSGCPSHRHPTRRPARCFIGPRATMRGSPPPERAAVRRRGARQLPRQSPAGRPPRRWLLRGSRDPPRVRVRLRLRHRLRARAGVGVRARVRVRVRI